MTKEFSAVPDAGLPSFDTGPLSWVIGEIREALGKSKAALLEAVGKDETGQSTLLQHAKTYLHQAHGAFQIIDVDGVGMISETVEDLLDRLKGGQLLLSEEYATSIGNAYQAVIEYLDELLTGAQPQPVRLFPYYRSLLEVRGAERIHPADLFFPNLSIRPQLPNMAGPDERVDYTQLRQKFERALLPFLKTAEGSKAQPLLEMIATVERLQTNTQVHAFWWVMHGFAEAVVQGQVPSELYVKQLFGRINLQIRRLAEGSSSISERLLRDALFFIARAANPSPRARQIRSVYQLDGLVPLDYEKRRYGQVDVEALALAKERLAKAKNTWSRIADDDANMWAAFEQELEVLVDASSKLNAPSLSKLLRELSGIARHCANSKLSRGLGLEIARSLLFIENALDNINRLPDDFPHRAEILTARLLSLMAGETPDVSADWMDELSRAAQQRQTVLALSTEMKSNLRQVEKVLDEYFLDPAKNASLTQIDPVMHQIFGALAVLDQSDAMAAVQHTRSAVQRFVGVDAEKDVALERETMQQVAQNIGALGFFIEALPQGADAAKGRFTWDAEHGAFKAVPVDRSIAAQGAIHVEVTTMEGESHAMAMPSAPASTPAKPAEPATAQDGEPMTVEEELLLHQQQSEELAASVAAQPDNLELQHQLKASLQQVRKDAALLDNREATERAQAAIDMMDQPDFVANLSQALKAEEAPAPAPAMPVSAPAPETDDEVDAELLEIFMMEADEVLAAVRELVPQSKASPHNQDVLTTIRRSFHTLKGSSRMVGLNVFGEAAASVEQVMNLWLAEARAGNETLFSMLDYVQSEMFDWVEEIKAHGRSGRTSGAIVAAANRVKDGGKFYVEEEVPVAAPVLVEPVAAVAEPAPEIAVIPEILPVQEPEAEPELEAVPVLEAEPVLEAVPVLEAEPVLEAVPVLEAEPVLEAIPVLEAEPVLEAIPVFDAEPVLEAVPVLEAEPVLEAVPVLDAGLDLELLPEAVTITPVSDVSDGNLHDDLDALEVVESLDAELLPAEAAPLDLDLIVAEMAELSDLAEELQMPLSTDDATTATDLTLTGLNADTATDAGSAQTDLVELQLLSDGLPALAADDAAPLQRAHEVSFDMQPLPQEAMLDAAPAPAEEFDLLPSPEADDHADTVVEMPLETVADAGTEPGHVSPDDLPHELVLRPDLALDLPADEAANLVGHDLLEASALMVDEPAELPEAGETVPPPGLQLEPELDALVADAEKFAVEGAALDAELTVSDELIEAAPADAETVDPAVSAIEVPVLPRDENIKTIGDLQISLPLFNIYLAETDHLVGLLTREFGEWRFEPQRAVLRQAVHAAHSLGGSSATVGFASLQDLAQSLEAVLGALEERPVGMMEPDYDLFDQCVARFRTMLQTFVAGELPPADLVLQHALQAMLDQIELRPEIKPQVHEEAFVAADESQFDSDLADMLENEAALAAAEDEIETLHATAEDEIETLHATAEDEIETLHVTAESEIETLHATAEDEIETLHVTAEDGIETLHATAEDEIETLHATVEVPVEAAPAAEADGAYQVPYETLFAAVSGRDGVAPDSGSDLHEVVSEDAPAVVPEGVSPVEADALAHEPDVAVTALTDLPQADAGVAAPEDLLQALQQTLAVAEELKQPLPEVAELIEAGPAPAGVDAAGLTEAGIDAAGLTEAGIDEPGLALTDAGVNDAGLPLAEAGVDESAAVPESMDAPQAVAEVVLSPQMAPAVREDVVVLDATAVMNDELDADLLPVFIEEGRDLLPQVGQQLRSWQQTPTDTSHAQALLRLLHTVKGSARMAGAMRLGQHAHEIETRIENIMHLGPLSPQSFEELIAHYDHSVYLFDVLQNPGMEVPLPAPMYGAATVAATADAPGDALTPAGSAPAAPITPAELPPAVRALLAAKAVAAAPVPLVRVRADILDRLVNQAGEVSIARSKLENEVGNLRQSLSELTENLSRLRGQLREVEIQAESQITSRMSLSNDRVFDPLEFDRFTRLQELTRMMAESVNDVASVQEGLGRTVDSATTDLAVQARLTRDLQQDLMRVRMVPFASISERLYRVTRQASKELDKRVNLDIRGTSVEVDRSVLEKMTGPFEHLLRNSIVHGIESRADRREVGKSEIGELLVEITQEGNEVVIHFKDDGAGLNYERIRAKARSQGLIGPDAEITDAEAADLIFEPGFSTSAELTELAGRGVGMDVVRSEAAGLGGRVEIKSETGKGAQFTIHLPLTLAVTQVVLLTTGGKTYAVPSVLVEQVQQIKSAPLATAYHDGSVQWQGQRVPMYYLSALLGDHDATPVAQRYSPVMILKSGSERVALHVDEVLGNREVVVKNVGPQLARMVGIAGATVLGSGDIVLILNPVPLSQRHSHEAARASRFAEAVLAPVDDGSVATAQAPQAPQAPQSPAADSHEMRKADIVMVVDDSLTVRKVTQRFLVREGYQVVLAKDGVDALEQLQSITPDVMLVDIEMPRMDGFDLTRNVRGDDRTRHIPIIMITSRTADKHRNYAEELGVNAYFGKPFQEDNLLATIRSLIRGEVVAR